MHGTKNDFRLQWPTRFITATGNTGDAEGRLPANGRSSGKWLRAGWSAISGIIGLVAIAALIGAGYEAIAGASDASHYPMTGRLVDVGGYRMHLDCRGEGTPAIIMDAGLGGSSLDWALVQDQLAATTKVCTFDRAGMGWSDAGPGPRSPRHLAAELWTLLTNAEVAGPYVLVGHSLAGKNARMFALAHPGQVAGMVLVDARSEYVDARTSKQDADAFAAALKSQATLYSVARRLGIARLFGATLADTPLVSPDTATEMVLRQTNPAAVLETTLEGMARTEDDPALANSTLGGMPLVVIAASESLLNTPNWVEAQKALSTLSTKGALVVAEPSGHAIQLQKPDVVKDAVESVLARLRSEP